ncbi:MAG: hypothetical protein RIC84_08800 [Aggregatilineales bacterium]
MAFEFGETSFTLNNFIAARYNITADTYELPGTLESGQMLEIDPQADTDMMKGYGVTTRLLTVETMANISVKSGGYDFSTYAIMTGSSTDTSGTTPNQVRFEDLISGGAGLPYWGVIGEAVTDDGGLIVIGLRCCKLDKRPKFTLDGTANKYNLSEAGGKAIPIVTSSALQLGRRRSYETLADWTANRPTDGAEFKAFFTDAAS